MENPNENQIPDNILDMPDDQAMEAIANATIATAGTTRRADIDVRRPLVLVFMIFPFLPPTRVGSFALLSAYVLRDGEASRRATASEPDADRVKRCDLRADGRDGGAEIEDAASHLELAIEGCRPLVFEAVGRECQVVHVRALP